jgi:ribosomal protein S8
VKDLNLEIRELAKRIKDEQSALSLNDIKKIVENCYRLYDSCSEKTIATHNNMLSALINAFCANLACYKNMTTLKEKKDLVKKFNQQGFLQKIEYLTQGFEFIYDNIKKQKGIHPDNFTISQLLRGLKILAHSQLIYLQNPAQI